MRAGDGVGLAATQANIPLRFFIIKIRSTNKYGDPSYGEPEVMINPSFVPVSEEMEVEVEGCLSLPGYTGPVKRYKHIEATWMDMRCRHHKEKMSDWRARVFQHEMDHINGHYFIDEGRLLDSERPKVEAFLKENRKRFDEMNAQAH